MASDKMKETVAVIGLGYVGLPLAVEFGKKRPTIGFDVNPERVEELRSGRDGTREVDPVELAEGRFLSFSSEPAELRKCRFFIIAVPTPIDLANRPDLRTLQGASEIVGEAMGKGAFVIYESTVYPGCTRNYCVPILERCSGLRMNEDFFVGYSPERINPGDRLHRLA